MTMAKTCHNLLREAESILDFSCLSCFLWLSPVPRHQPRLPALVKCRLLTVAEQKHDRGYAATPPRSHAGTLATNPQTPLFAGSDDEPRGPMQVVHQCGSAMQSGVATGAAKVFNLPFIGAVARVPSFFFFFFLQPRLQRFSVVPSEPQPARPACLPACLPVPVWTM
jgi:hypothetical protein